MCRSAEPTVDELLHDPIAQMLMQRDGLCAEQVWSCLRRVQSRRLAEGAGRLPAVAGSQVALEEAGGPS
jgi:hypothetical protein